MTDFEETAAYCALGDLFGFTPLVARNLVDTFGSAAAVFKASPQARIDMARPYSKLTKADFTQALDLAAERLHILNSQGKIFLPLGDERFPAALAQCPDAPMGLYMDASSPPEMVFREIPFVSIVGTRDISPHGREWCRKIVETFSYCRYRPAIVSGFALGTDIEAHLMALECGLPTIAVLPTGIDAIYPSRHYETARRLRECEGCALVTDYPPGTVPQAINFLRRNRIIAGLSRATVLIESKAKGGGLITAKFAFDYDRDLYALPGRPDDLRSMGCNALIASSKARIIISAEELSRNLGLGRKYIKKNEWAEKLEDLFPDEHTRQKVVQAMEIIREKPGITPEEIGSASGWPYRESLQLVMEMENKGIIMTDILQGCSIK